MSGTRILGASGARLTVTLERRPVLERELDEEGHRKGYIRTKAVLESRVCELSDWSMPTRVDVVFNPVTVVTVSIDTGRAVGNADWMLSAESQKMLRAERRLRYPAYGKRPPAPKAPLAGQAPVEETRADAQAGG